MELALLNAAYNFVYVQDNYIIIAKHFGSDDVQLRYNSTPQNLARVLASDHVVQHTDRFVCQDTDFQEIINAAPTLHFHHLRTLELSFTRLDDTQALVVARVIANSQQLLSLTLRGNDFTSQGLHHILRAHRQTLRVLDVDNTDITRIGQIYMCTNLRVLLLQQTDVSVANLITLSRNIGIFAHLDKLAVSMNIFDPDDVQEFLANIAARSSIQHLCVGNVVIPEYLTKTIAKQAVMQSRQLSRLCRQGTLSVYKEVAQWASNRDILQQITTFILGNNRLCVRIPPEFWDYLYYQGFIL